jgi:hypothetical protein
MPIFRSTEVVYCCIWCSALGVVAEVLRSRCVVLCTVCLYDARTHIHQISFEVFKKVTYFDLIGYNEANICNMFSYM